MFKYLLYKAALFLLRHLPSGLSYQLAAFLSDAQYLFSFRDRKAVKNNLRHIVPQGQDVSPLTREVFRNFGRYLIEFFQMKEMVNHDFIKDKVRIQGIEHLDAVSSAGKGGVIVTAHIGNWELGAVLLSVLGYPLMAVALPHKERPVNDLFNQQREAKGVTVVPTNTALRHCVEQLNNKKFIALVADRDFGSNGVIMDFLGRKTLLPKGPAMFSLKTGAPIVPVFLIRNADGTFKLSCHEPIYPSQEKEGGSQDGAVLEIMRCYLRVIEQQIRAHPSQWLLFREFGIQ